ncbi:hypothetical protein R3P38DRAFT_2736772, partial [Favolaschia claudopus]
MQSKRVPGATRESPFSSLFATNTAPSDAECDAIRQFLSTLRKEHALVTNEIARMQDAITNLTNKAERLQEAIDAHQALVSLARRLPEDVVREIFFSCLSVTGNPVMSWREAPILLTHVCANWRRIAIATPQLWSCLHVVVPNSARLGRLSAAADMWLMRSGSLPLTITLAVSAACEATSDNVATMIDVVANFSARWKNVTLTLSPQTILSPLTNLSPSDVPILESITFAAAGSGWDWQNLVVPLAIPWRKLGFISTPSLRHASFASLGGNFLALTLPWPHLQSLSLTAGPVKSASSYEMPAALALLILEQCPRIASFTICLTSDKRDAVPVDKDNPPPALVLSHLTSLAIDNREYEYLHALAFFRPLRVPALKHFAYRGPKYNKDTAHNLPFISLFGAIHMLESLTLDLPGITKTAFARCVDLLPNLACLRLEKGEGYDLWTALGQPSTNRDNAPASANDLVKLLTPDTRAASSSSLDTLAAPSLTQLQVMDCHPLADNVLFDFILARAEAEKPMKRVEVRFQREKEFDMMQYLGELVSRGLEVELRYAEVGRVVPVWSPWEGRDEMA